MSDSGEAESSEQEYSGEVESPEKESSGEAESSEKESSGEVESPEKESSGEAESSEQESSDEAESPLQESQPKSQEGETSKNSNKRTLDEDSKNETSGLETLKKVAKSIARKLEFVKIEDDDALPLACSICREPFLNPVVTNCNHYFCNHCALKHHKNNNNCFVCNQPTLGIFNTALDIKRLIAKVREKARAMLKEVSTISKDADVMAAVSAGMVEEVEAMVGTVKADGAQVAADPFSWDALITLVETMDVAGTKAREIAEKVAEMVKEVNATTETAKAEMGKALVMMKRVRWNV